LGKKVAPWTSVDATKTSILGTAFDQEGPGTGGVPPRKMKILKPVRKGVGETGVEGEGIRVDVVRDVGRMEVKEGSGGEEQGKGQVASKNVGGGAFHWMK
jgi:hypothetical protein